MQNDVTATTRIEGFRTEIDAAGHALVADEPADVGGTNEGPTPYDLLSAALASCTTMTIKMYATHKGLDIQSVTVAVRHAKIHAKDCESCETEKGYVDRLARVLELEGDLDEAARARMVEIADRCPVHRTLHSEVVIETRLA